MTAGWNKGKKGPAREAEARLAGMYEEYYGKIARYVYTRIGDKTEAEDIAGEVFLKALESLNTYEERGVPMQAWLFKIAHNMVVDHLRKASTHKVVPIDVLPLDAGIDPVDIAEQNLELERVAGAMEKLTEEQREVLRLRFFGGLSSKETAIILGKSDGAVREMQRAALEKLRRLLTGNDF